MIDALAWLTLTLALAIIPSDCELIDRCDWIELNHVFREDWDHEIFCQWIFWRVNREGYSEVIDWRMAKEGEAAQRIWRNGCPSGWRLQIVDCGKLRRIEASSVQETTGNYDPELWDRKYLPQEKRRRLKAAAVRR